MAAFACQSQSQTGLLHRVSYRDILLHCNSQEAPPRSSHSNCAGEPTPGNLTAAAAPAPAAAATAAATAAAMAMVLGRQDLQRQATFCDADCSHNELYQLCTASNQGYKHSFGHHQQPYSLSQGVSSTRESQHQQQQHAPALRAAASFTAYNPTFNTWHVNLCGLSAADAVGMFSTQLQNISSLEYPGGVLMCVVTGVACNDTIEQTGMLERCLLSCIAEQDGVACPDFNGAGSRGGRIGNVVVAFIRVDPSMHVVDATCMEATTAAACEVRQLQPAGDLQHDAGPATARHSRTEINVLVAGAWPGTVNTHTPRKHVWLCYATEPSSTWHTTAALATTGPLICMDKARPLLCLLFSSTSCHSERWVTLAELL
jgi:hypothetical protein